MEWLIGIYLIVGVLKAIRMLGNPNPALKPIWVSTEGNLFRWMLNLSLYVVIWPLARR